MKFIRFILGLERLKQSENILKEANARSENAKKRANESYKKLLESVNISHPNNNS